jgi:pimeloyl-ACP methyl ester carboxylesterase
VKTALRYLALWAVGVMVISPRPPAAAGQAKDGGGPSVRRLWERCRADLPPFSFQVLSDRIVTSDSDPRLELRRLEVRFTSQVVGQWDRRMTHTGIIHMPADPAVYQAPERKGKVVVIANACGDTTMIDNYGEPIAARTGYPTMVLPIPGEYDGQNGESAWVYFLRAELEDTKDPINHQYFRFAIPYLRALDVFAGVLGEPKIRAVIGGHSKRAPAAFNAAAMDPDRVAGVVYMGMESTFAGYEGKLWQAISPVHSQDEVVCPVLYLGATNEDGYEMFNISRLQSRIRRPWTIELIPNYRHATASEIQIIDWQMWIGHVFEARPVASISELAWTETAEGTDFRARIESPNKLIQAKIWYVYCDDVPFWRDLMWYPAPMSKNGEFYESSVAGKLPDAWFVEVKDLASGFVGYVSSLPQDITHKETKERVSRGSRSRNWEPKRGAVKRGGD